MTSGQMERVQRQVNQVNKEIKDFYQDTLKESKQPQFKPVAIRHFKSLYDEIKGIESKLKDNSYDFQTQLQKLNRFKELSKLLIIKVSIELL